MLKNISNIATFIIYIAIFIIATIDLAYAETVTLKSNTVVVVKNNQEISTKQYKTGQEVILYVGADVKVKGKIVIKSGAPVIASVQSSQQEEMAGGSGKIIVAVQLVETVDGQNIPISGQFLYEADSERGGTIAVGVILCPLVLLNKGEPGVIPVGAQIRALTISETEIEV